MWRGVRIALRIVGDVVGELREQLRPDRVKLAACQREQRGAGHVVRARGAGQVFTGIDAPYEPPRRPEVRLAPMEVEVSAAVRQILDALKGWSLSRWS